MDNISYTPPKSSEIQKAQNKIDSLRLLLAQRKLYSHAKKWLTFRMWGMGGIAIFSPFVAFLWPSYSVAIGAVAGLWIFLGRTIFLLLERKQTLKASAVQEIFDVNIFQMPQLAVRPYLPTLEDISKLAGVDKDIESLSKKENLKNWYTINPKDSGFTTVAICQRTNASYSSSLLVTTSTTWIVLITSWALLLVVFSMILQLNVGTFLLAICLPLLAPFLDTVEFWRSFKTASIERTNLTVEIEDKLKKHEVNGSDLLIWQTNIFNLRRNMPGVPDIIYKITRKINENAMKSAANQLSDQARSK